MARLRSAPASQAAQPPDTRQALREKTNTTRPTAPVYENDGHTDHLVKDAKPRRGRPRKEQSHAEDELFMTGALAREEGVPAATVPAQSDAPLMTTDELAKSDGAPPPTAAAKADNGRRPRRTGRKVAQSAVVGGAEKRINATEARKDVISQAVAVDLLAAPSPAALPTAPPPTAAPRLSSDSTNLHSELSISPSPPRPGQLRSRSSILPPSSVLRGQSTPFIEGSIPALKNFKRRARQPSMLATMQQRTASARPSAVHNAVLGVEDPSIYDFEGSEHDEDDFAPEAEGTPVLAARGKRVSGSGGKKPKAIPGTEKAKALSNAKKRKSDEAEASSRAIRSKRRKYSPTLKDDDILDAEVVQILPSQPPIQVASSARAATPRPHATSDVMVIDSSIGSSPSSTPLTEPPSSAQKRPQPFEGEDIVPSTEDPLQRDEEEQEDVAAEPARHEENDTDLPPSTIASPPSSPTNDPDLADPVTQISPRAARSRPAAVKATLKPLSTATLQALLPKRRVPPKPRQRKSEYDFASASSSEEEGGGKGAAAKRPKPAAASRGKKAAPRRTTTTAPAPARKGGKKAPPPARTYGRTTAAAVEDKENEDDFDEDEEDSLETSGAAVQQASADYQPNAELEAARRKFAELDQWEMEFESMSGAEEHRSSSMGWR